MLDGLLIITGDADSKGQVGGTFLDAKVRQYRPDIVFVDGAYLLHDDRNGKSKTEKLYNLTQDLKRLARRFELPFVISTQMGRDAEDRAGGQSAIQWSDSFAQDADALIELFQNAELRERHIMRIILQTQREGEVGMVDVNWNLETMDFGESADLGDRASALTRHSPVIEI